MTAEPIRWATRLYDAYVFDMDGTIYLGDHLLPGARRLIEELRERNIPVRFLTNNPTKDLHPPAATRPCPQNPPPADARGRTGATPTSWLLQPQPGLVGFPSAEEPLSAAFERAGIPMSDDPEKIDVVVASYDRTFDYRKLQIAFDAIWLHRRATLVGTNPDRFCPFPGGKGQPDCAAIVAAIEACTNTKAEIVLGKPNAEMARVALAGLDLELKDCLMVGDRLMTDIQLAVNAGMASAMPLTGESTLDEALARPEESRPTYVVDRIDHLLPPQVWEERGWALE